MRTIKDVEKRAATFYRNNSTDWLAGNFSPLAINLQPPTARDVDKDGGEAFRRWKGEWASHWAPVEYADKRLGVYGVYSVPTRLVIDSPEMAARLAGTTHQWEHLVRVLELLVADLGEEIPSTTVREVLARKATAWETWSDVTVDQFVAVTRWLHTHDASAYYQRELPIMGVNTKWLENHGGLVRALVGEPVFKPKPVMVELRSLDPEVPVIGGLDHVSGEAAALSGVPVGFAQVVIVENYTTFIALPQLPETLAVYGGGFSVPERIGFIGANVPVWYWSDLDTAGFAMLTRVRSRLPQVRSVLMDLDTTLSHLPFSVEETQTTAVSEELLHADEQATLALLRERAEGSCLRIEQERIGFAWATQKLQELSW